MEQKDLLKYALMAVGVYLIYQYIQSKGGFSALFGTASVPTTLPTTSTTAAGITIQAPAPTGNPATTAQMIQAIAAQQNPPFTIGTADQWSYYYSQVRGIPGPDPGSYMGDNRAEQLTFAEWWKLASAAGLGNVYDGVLPFNRPDAMHALTFGPQRWLM